MNKNKTIVGILQINALDTISILAYITDACNYDCYYCYNHKPRKNAFLDLNYLEKFIENMFLVKNKNIYVELIGGETLLHKDLFNMIKSLYKYYPKIKFGIYSNFSFPVESYLKYLNLNVYMTLTWHSLPNDLENKLFLEKIQKIPKQYFDSIAEVHVMYENKYLKEALNAYNFIYNLYPTSTELALLDHNYLTNQIYFCDNCFYLLSDLQYYNSTLSKVADRRKFFTITYIDGSKENISLTTASNTPELSHYKFWLCDAGYNNFYIWLNGNIFPCQSYVTDYNGSNTKLCIGNIITNVDVKSLQFKRQICKVDRCNCSWEVNKNKIF